MKSSKLLEDMANRGIKFLDCYGVDNALVSTFSQFLFHLCIPNRKYFWDMLQAYNNWMYYKQVRVGDPTFLGYFIDTGVSAAAKVVRKVRTSVYNKIHVWVSCTIFKCFLYILIDCRRTHKKRLVYLFAEGKGDQSLWLSTVSWTRQWLVQSIRKLVAFAIAGVMYYTYPTYRSAFQVPYLFPLNITVGNYDSAWLQILSNFPKCYVIWRRVFTIKSRIIWNNVTERT